MKKLALHLIAVICGMPATAQTYYSFPDSGAVWSELIEGGSPVTPYQASYFTYTMGGDTVIGAYTYRKFTTSGQWPERGAIREDTASHRIYFAGNCMMNYQDTLIYDFDLAVGDTAYTDASGETYVVFDADSVLILGQYRKRIQMGSQFGGSDEWIVGIGSTNHPLKPLLPMEFEGNYTLMCLQENSSGIYVRYSVPSNNGPWYSWLHPGYCGLLDVADQQISGVVISAENRTLSIQALSFSPSCSYTILDVNGKEIERTVASNQTSIDLHSCTPGIYILQMTDNTGNFFAKKFALY